MKLSINLTLSLLMLALCVWLVWPRDQETKDALELAFRHLTWRGFGPYLAGFFGLLAFLSICRAWRWNYLLAPLGVRLGFARLMAVSAVGFMAILALPARLGEFVRPALIRKRGHVSASAALGTVAVERIIDGLIISIMVFACFFAMRHHAGVPGWMMPTAYVALGVFVVATVGLVLWLKWPDAMVTFTLKVTLLSVVWPRGAKRLEHKLHDLIRGFAVLKDPKNLLAFVGWSVAYWGANGLATWVLARGMDVDLSMAGAFATMGLVAVGITLPNSPGLVGQFQWFTMLGVSLYLHHDPAFKDLRLGLSPEVYGKVLAYALFLHGLQVIWYVGAGLVAMGTSHVSFSEMWASRKLDPEAAAGDAPGA